MFLYCNLWSKPMNCRFRISASLCCCGKRLLPNPALNLAPFGRWTLRNKSAQRRLALR